METTTTTTTTGGASSWFVFLTLLFIIVVFIGIAYSQGATFISLPMQNMQYMQQEPQLVVNI